MLTVCPHFLETKRYLFQKLTLGQVGNRGNTHASDETIYTTYIQSVLLALGEHGDQSLFLLLILMNTS